MEESGLEKFEDPSDIIEDVVEISVENSVEANLLLVNNNSEVSAENTETDVMEVVPTTQYY